MYKLPTAHKIDPATGTMGGATGRYEKRLRDLAGIYADQTAFAAAVEKDGDRVVYYVHETRPAAAHGDLIFGTTFMEPGRIGDEYYVTRGHIHARANRPETYYGESGTGLMLMESPDGETQILEIAPRVMVYVPPMWIHRSVNTGTEPLVMSFCYPADSGRITRSSRARAAWPGASSPTAPAGRPWTTPTIGPAAPTRLPPCWPPETEREQTCRSSRSFRNMVSCRSSRWTMRPPPCPWPMR